MSQFFQNVLWDIALFFLICFLIDRYLRAKGYRGPLSDHFDGKRFHNFLEFTSREEKRADRSFKGLHFFIHKLFYTHWHKRPLPHGSTTPAERVVGSEIVVTFINHATVLLQTEGLNILTDPVWSHRVSPFRFFGPARYMDPGVTLTDLPHIDLILLSHNHYDHMDIRALRRITRRDHPAVYTTLGNRKYLASRKIFGAVEMDWGQSQKFSDHITVDCVSAQHFSARALSDRNKTLWAGFVIRTPHGDIYFAADTGYGPFISRIQKMYPDGFRFALLPIGAYEPRWFMHTVHMGPDDAVMMYQDLKVRQAMAIHCGTFDLGIDGQDDAANSLQKLLKEEKYADVHFTVLQNGEVLRIA